TLRTRGNPIGLRVDQARRPPLTVASWSHPRYAPPRGAEHAASTEPKVTGSNPVGRALIFRLSPAFGTSGAPRSAESALETSARGGAQATAVLAGALARSARQPSTPK